MTVKDTCMVCHASITTDNEKEEFSWVCTHTHNGTTWIQTEIVEK